MRLILGVLLVWGGCGWVGLRACAALGQRVRLLEKIGLSLEIAERELVLNKTSLPDLLERLAAEENGQGNRLFLHCKAGLEQGKCFTDAWADALEGSGLEERDKQLLGTLSIWLGRYDARGQAEALTRLRADWEEHIALARERARSLGRVYGTLGMTAGGFLALMLL